MTAGLNPEQGRCSASRTLIAQLPPLPGSNCSTVFAKDNSPWGVSVSRTKLSLQSGMQYSPRSLYSSTGLVPPPRTYLHQSRLAGDTRVGYSRRGLFNSRYSLARVCKIGAGVPPSRLVSTTLFDLWVHTWRRKRAQGEVIVVRYADDSAPRAQRAEPGSMCATGEPHYFELIAGI